MAFTYIKKDYQGPSGLGEGIVQGLQNIGQSKIQEIMQRNQAAVQEQKNAQALRAFGLSEQEARALAGAPESIQREALKGISQGNTNQAVMQMLGLAPPNQQQGPQQEFPPQEGEMPPMQGGMQGAAQQPGGSQPTFGQRGVMPSTGGGLLGPRISTQDIFKLADINLRKEQFKEKMAAGEKSEIRKDFNEAIKEAQTKKNEAVDTLDLIGRLEELDSGGNLDTPLMNGLANALSSLTGGIIPASVFLSPESEEFTKLSNTFIKQAKALFGSRVTDKDLEYFMKTIPTLANSQEGRKLIYQQMQRMASMQRAEFDALHKYSKQHKNENIPAGWRFEVDEKTTKRRKKYGDQFMAGIRKAEGLAGETPSYKVGDMYEIPPQEPGGQPQIVRFDGKKFVPFRENILTKAGL